MGQSRSEYPSSPLITVGTRRVIFRQVSFEKYLLRCSSWEFLSVKDRFERKPFLKHTFPRGKSGEGGRISFIKPVAVLLVPSRSRPIDSNEKVISSYSGSLSSVPCAEESSGKFS